MARSRPALVELSLVVPRAVAFATKAALPFRRRGRPRLRPSPLTLAGVATDELFVTLAVIRLRDSSSLSTRVLDQGERAVERLEALGVLDDPLSGHVAPPAPQRVRVSTRHKQGHWFDHVSFESAWQPWPGFPRSAEWLSNGPNDVVHAFVLRKDTATPRPWLISLHGTRMGRPSDLHYLGSKRLQEALDVNIAHVILPLHGPRGGDPRTGGFPGTDGLTNYLATTQAISDVRQVMAWARTQGATGFASYGISLGGHLSALLASVEPDLQAAVAGIPTCDVTAMLADTIRERLGDDQLATSHILDPAQKTLNRLASPLAYRPLLEHHRLFLYASLGDRVVGADQAQRLWSHWDEPSILWMQGGHIANPVARARRFVVDSLFGLDFAGPMATTPELVG